MTGTPILDLEQAPPELKSSRRNRLIGLAIGVVLGLLLAYFTRDDAPNLNFLYWIPALYLAVAVHELGHLTAGAIVGMKPGGLVIGGLTIMKSGDRYSVRFDFKRIIGGGMALPLTQKDKFTPRQFAWMVAGGPVASLALSVLCGTLSILQSDYSGSWINVLFWMALLTMTLLIPASAGLNKSDGARLRDLLHHPDGVGPWIALVALQSDEKRGVRPRDWDPELVERALITPPDVNEYPYSELLMFYRQADLGNEAAATEHLENVLATSVRGQKLFCHACYLEASAASALMRKSAAQARVWLDRACKLRKPLMRDSVDAAIAIAEERYDDALIHLRKAREFFRKRKLDSGLARFAIENLEKYEALCTSALSTPAA